MCARTGGWVEHDRSTHHYHGNNPYGAAGTYDHLQRCNADWVPDPCRGESCVSFLLAEPGYVLAYPKPRPLCS